MFEVFIATCDKTNFILPTSLYLFQKYLPKNIDWKLTILGYIKPSFDLGKANFISMKSKQDINVWTHDLYSIISKSTSKYIIFTLDDFLLVDYANSEGFLKIIEMMNENDKIGICNLGYAPQYVPEKDRIVVNENNYLLFQRDVKSDYKLNCQPAVWRKDYFVKYFQHKHTPWKFELANLARNDDFITLSSAPIYKNNTRIYPDKPQKPIFSFQLMSALSNRLIPNKISIIGLKKEDLEHIFKKYLDSNKCVYGMSNGIDFHQCKYNFNMNMVSEAKLYWFNY